jgi:mono/diheme cytochrome c family protein
VTGVFPNKSKAWLGVRIALLLLSVGIAVAADRSYPRPGEPPAGDIVPADDLSGFKYPDNLRLELIASEPTIVAPVAITFDEDGRLWVVEMSTFMPDLEGTNERAPLNRIVILESTRGDGVFDKSTVFLDNLVLPRAVLPCYGGALVLEPPTLYFCPDADHDGHADAKIPLLSGFGGLESPEHAANGLLYGLDNWIYFSQHPIRFRFDGKSVITQPTPAHGQWGIAQDDAGRLYYVGNSDALHGDYYPKHYASRNPDLNVAAGMDAVICKDLTVWPTHPTAVNRGYQTDVLRRDGSLREHTAACTPLIYRADLLAPEYRNNAFCCEPAGNLIKFMLMSEANGVPTAKPAYPDHDFLTSTDPRFRPVSLTTGPDGALYLADMYRGVLQHRVFITDYLRDLSRKGHLVRPISEGRIYRLVPSSGVPLTPLPKLSQASTDQLVAYLDHPNSWCRETAQRLLVERSARDVSPKLRELAKSAPNLTTRLRALWTLDGLDGATPEDSLHAMADPSPVLRQAGCRIGEAWLDREDIVASIGRLIDDSDRIVRVQAALSAGELKASSELLSSALSHHESDPLIRSAVASGLKSREQPFLDSLLKNPEWPKTQADRDFLTTISDCILRCQDSAPRTAFIEWLTYFAQAGDQRASLLMTSLSKFQRLDSQSPRTLTLSAEPKGWAQLVAMHDYPLNKIAFESNWYLTWPGRPPMNPPRRLRALTAKELDMFNRGSFLFNDCKACHGPEGKGIPGTAPPLAGSARVQGPATRLARVLLHGFEGQIEREGAIYNGVMSPAPRSNDADLAALMTYIRRAWGNGGDPVTPEMITQVRALTEKRNRPWTTEELEKIK